MRFQKRDRRRDRRQREGETAANSLPWPSCLYPGGDRETLNAAQTKRQIEERDRDGKTASDPGRQRETRRDIEGERDALLSVAHLLSLCCSISPG